MEETRMAMPEDRLAAIRARREGKLGVNWGMYETSSARAFAEEQGWDMPSMEFKAAFIKKMLESDENFELALTKSGIDVYIPTE